MFITLKTFKLYKINLKSAPAIQKYYRYLKNVYNNLVYKSKDT